MKVAVVGSTGRVGSVLCAHLADRFEVLPIARIASEPPEELAGRASDGVDVVLNAAGVAHIENASDADLERLWAANVDLPPLLAAAAVESGASLIHISSVKATEDAKTPYGRSKFEGDRRLSEEWAHEFRRRQLALVIVRPLALLFPPLDAGKVAKLRFVGRLPEQLVPRIPLPVLRPEVFLETVADLIMAVDSEDWIPGLTERSFGRADWANLATVRSALRLNQRDSV